MYIVGTSGHIDHGKTSLIKALTGTDCDRLPEEKEREMTIDIGFASINYPKFGTVSIIDVPGHERFIRNMVAGAWGIDLALLVVAVDDGWMPQTEDHFRVLQILGIERLIIVMNKIDLADGEMIDFVEEEINEKVNDTRFKDSNIIQVSSKTNQGIEELREAIVVNLRKLSKIADAKKPYLYVDRVFASKGYGTVITGTLKNGIFHEDESVQILPVKKEARIKKIESHFNALTEGNPSQRTALNLSGVSTDNIKRGSIIIKNNFFAESNDIIAKIELLGKIIIKNNLGTEILIGTSAVKGKLILMDEKIDDQNFTARIKFDSSWFFYPGQPFVITSPGGYRIIGGGTVLFPEYNASRQKHSVKKHLGAMKNFDKEEIIEFIISVNLWIKKDDLFSLYPDTQKNIEKIIESLIEKGSIDSIDNYILKSEYHKKAIDSITSAINHNVGLKLKEVSDYSKTDIDICKILIPAVMSNNTIIEKDGRYFSGDSITEDTLSDNKKKILADILNNKSNGIEIDKIKDDIRKKEIRDLIKLDFIISLDGNIAYHKNIYNDFKDRIMKLFDEKDKITLPEAKDAVGLSRKFIIPLLNRIEGDGLIKRLGDFRIKV